MNVQNESAIVSTAAATWVTVPGRNVATPCLKVSLQRSAERGDKEMFVEEIRITPPRMWKPGTVFIGPNADMLGELKAGSTVLNGPRGTTWEVSQRITRDAWTIILSNTQPESSLPTDFSLDMAILLERPNGSFTSSLVVNVDEAQETLSFTVPPEPANDPWILLLESDPQDTNALVRGQELVLRWKVQNIHGDAELRGSLPGANTIRIANGDSGSRTVRALGESVYSLTATVLQDGKLVEIVRRVNVNMAAPQFGLNLEFVPACVFPGGPVVCYRSAYNVKNITFTRSGDEPSLAAKNIKGKETTIVDSFVVPIGPKEGQSWSIGAIYTSPEGEKSARGNQVTGISPVKVENSMFLNLPVSFGMDDEPTVHGMAAGAFIVTSAGPNPQVAKREWIAIARASSLELWARDPAVGEVKAEAERQGRKWKNNWLEDALAGQFLGVAAANDATNPDIQCLVALRRKAGSEEIAELIEIDLPLREDNPHRQILAISDARFVRGTVRIIPAGNRIFLFGDGVVISYERNVRLTAYRDEPTLAMVAFREWEVVGLSPKCAADATAYLFALEKKSGILLRFDVQKGIVLAARVAAGANDKVARLDELQRAQACLSPTPPAFPRESLEEGRGYTGKDADGNILEYLNAIDENSTMIALDGVLLVRSEVVDPSVGQTIQDRAYDPRLDVWVRCGHPFGNANSSSVNFFAATQSTLYCLADDELRYVEGSLPAYLGFMASDYQPIDPQALAVTPWPETFGFPTVDNKTPLEVRWRDGRLSADVFNHGQLRLALVSDGETIINIDAEINRETGSIEQVVTIVDLTRREVPLCQWNARMLTIAPMNSQLQIHMQAGIVLPFSYSIADGYSKPIKGESSTGNTLDIPSITGQTLCTLEFKYLGGDAKKSTLDARAKLFIVKGIVADLQWEGKHASLFGVEIEEGYIVRLSLEKQAQQ